MAAAADWVHELCQKVKEPNISFFSLIYIMWQILWTFVEERGERSFQQTQICEQEMDGNSSERFVFNPSLVLLLQFSQLWN